MIDDPIDLWKEFLGRLDVPQDRGLEPEGRDSDLLVPLAEALSLDPSQPIEPQIVSSSITSADLTLALLSVVAPYASMLTDLLSLYIRAGADSGNASLTIRWEFSRDRPVLEVDLDAFRAWERHGRKITRLQESVLWTHDSLLIVASMLDSVPEPADLDVESGNWLAEYDVGVWPAWTPGAAANRADMAILPGLSGVSAERPVDAIRGIWNLVVRASRRLSARRDDLEQQRYQVRTSGSDSDNQAWTPLDPWTLKNLDRENWAGRVLVGIDRIQSAAPEDVRDLEQFVAQLPVRVTPIETVQDVLLEVLRLPFWNHRRELYAAWVSTLLVDALGDIRLLTSRGRFEYRSAGSQLAGTGNGGSASLQLWSELESPLPEPGKRRKTSIKPDYSVLTEPVTFPESAVLVVEVKHHARQDTGLFGDALWDYALGRPEARVVLVNYGPADQLPVAMARPADISRCHAIGGLRPDNAKAISKFMAVVREAAADAGHRLAAAGGMADPSAAARRTSTVQPLSRGQQDPVAVISLTWSKGGAEDLDLHVWVQPTDGAAWQTINWRSPRAQTGIGWLEEDVKRAPGYEVVGLAAMPHRLSVSVHRYSDSGTLEDAQPQVTFRGGGIETTVRCTNSQRAASWWNVLEFRSSPATIVINNELVDRIPQKIQA